MEESICWLIGIVILIYSGSFERVTVVLAEVPMPYATVRGIRLYYQIRGRGEPLVLLHDGLGCTKSFARQVTEFSKHFRVICYDRRGYGRSDHIAALRENWLNESVEDLSHFLHRLNVKEAHLSGVCVGGAIALLFAAENPARVRSIAVAGTCCYGEEDMAPKALKLYPSLENMPSDWLLELSEYHGTRYGKWLYRIFYEAIREENGYPFKGYDLRPTLSRIKSPVMVIYGDRDQLFDLEQALTMYRHLDRSNLCIIPNCGHLPNQQRPEDFNREVVGFILDHQNQ